MLEHIKRVLDDAGVTPEDAAALAPLVVAPSTGTVNAAELGAANEAQVALLWQRLWRQGAPSNLARRCNACSRAWMPPSLLCPTTATGVSGISKGWPPGGWTTRSYSATRALNRSLTLLQGLVTLPAQACLGRSFNTFGQILQHQGLLHDARLEFERALDCKRAGKERYGTALTLGNRGRLYMELGDFAAAARYVRRDLRLMNASPQPETARLQLLSLLGYLRPGTQQQQMAS